MNGRSGNAGRTLDCDVAVVGGSLGGVAAALAAADAGARTVLTEATDWLGGQLTSQGVSAPDEHRYVESFGVTEAYAALRERVRGRYRERYDVDPADEPLNPGNCWVSRLGFEPAVGVDVVEELLADHVRAGRLTILREHEPVDATVEGDRVVDVVVEGDGGRTAIEAEYVLDATDLGALLPLAGTEYVTGAESRAQTGEPDAKAEPAPDEVQAFTYCFAVEHVPGEDHTVEKPAGYERFREEQPYTFTYDVHEGRRSTYRMFEEGPDGESPFWTYRRLFDAAQFPDADRDRDVAMINWSSNDYRGANVIDRSPERRAEILAEAKRLARGFLYWLQTDAPRDDGGTGYPGLRLLPEVMDTEDGLSKRPYVRESRRIVPRKRVVQTDVTARANDGARARRFPDSVGVGHYAIDIHDCVGDPDRNVFETTLPFQIPLGALLPADGPTNLLPACKNIGTTHVTNGCYRLHPVEWNVGESAGALAAFCLGADRSPASVWESDRSLRAFQYRLVDRGVPLAWTVDVPPGHELFEVTQLLVAAGAIPRTGARADRLEIEPGAPLTNREFRRLLVAGLDVLDAHATVPLATDPDATVDRGTAARALDAAGLDATLSAEPTWADLCGAFEGPFAAAFGDGV